MTEPFLFAEPDNSSKPQNSYRLSSPKAPLLSMAVFLILIGFLALMLMRQIARFFQSNPGLNGLILGVLIIGILFAFGQVLRLYREIHWVNSFRSGDEENVKPPLLLAPMRALLGRKRSMSLSQTTSRTILDSIATRLDENRDILRYMVGLLVFLGLLGTFWGLLETISAIGNTIQSLETGQNTTDTLDNLKSGLQTPLGGMGTAFSSSLFGLSGSLILGFLDLQAARAQNRFYTELENWLASVTQLSADNSDNPDLQIIIDELRQIYASNNNPRTNTAMIHMAESIQALVKTVRSEQLTLRQWVERQAIEQQNTRQLLELLVKQNTNKDQQDGPVT